MRTTTKLNISGNRVTTTVGITVRLLSLMLLVALVPVGLLLAGLIWLEDGGPVLTVSILDGASEASKVPAFRVANIQLEKWDICQLPASMGNPERLIVIPTLTTIGRIITRLNLDKLPAILYVALGRVSPTVLFRQRVTITT